MSYHPHLFHKLPYMYHMRWNCGFFFFWKGRMDIMRPIFCAKLPSNNLIWLFWWSRLPYSHREKSKGDYKLTSAVITCHQKQFWLQISQNDESIKISVHHRKRWNLRSRSSTLKKSGWVGYLIFFIFFFWAEWRDWVEILIRNHPLFFIYAWFTKLQAVKN